MLRYFISFFSGFLLFLFSASTALALEGLPPPSTPSGASAYSFVRVILGIVIKMAIPVLTVLIIFFAFQIVAAQGDERTLSEAKHKMVVTLVVAAIFLGLGLLVSIIYNTGNSIGYLKLF